MNSDNPLVFFAFIVAGAALMAVVAAICHEWSTRLIEKRRHIIIRLCVPLLLIGSLFVIPPVLTLLYSIIYPGYQLQEGELPGPMGDSLAGFILLLWPYGVFVLLVYGLAAAFSLRRRT